MNLEALLEKRQFEECFAVVTDLLKNGRPSYALKLLGIIHEAAGTTDEIRSRSLYTIAYVLEKMNRIEEAHRIYLEQDYSERKNTWDWSASCRAQDLFCNHGLRLTPPRFPFRVQIELTNRCNLKCIMCPRRQMIRPPQDIDVGLLERLMDEVAREGGPVVSLYFMGEPLLHPQIETIVEITAAATKRSPIQTQFGIQTNGVLLTPERSRRLLERGLRGIGVSVDGDEGPADGAGVGGRYDVVKNNVKALIDHAREMNISTHAMSVTTLMSDPAGAEALRFQRAWADVGCQVAVKPFVPVVGEAYLDSAGAVRQVTPDKLDRFQGYCGSGTRLLVLSNGTYAFCCSDIDGQMGLGHAREMSLLDAWHSPRMKDIRSRILQGHYTGLAPCERCFRWKQGTTP